MQKLATLVSMLFGAVLIVYPVVYAWSGLA